MIDETEAKTKIRAYLSRSLRGRALGDEEDIFALGLVHSLFAMQIVLFVEREFDVELDPEQIALTELRSVDCIFAAVKARKSGAQA